MRNYNNFILHNIHILCKIFIFEIENSIQQISYKYVLNRETSPTAIPAKECKNSYAWQFSSTACALEHGIFLPELD